MHVSSVPARSTKCVNNVCGYLRSYGRIIVDRCVVCKLPLDEWSRPEWCGTGVVYVARARGVYSWRKATGCSSGNPVDSEV